MKNPRYTDLAPHDVFYFDDDPQDRWTRHTDREDCGDHYYDRCYAIHPVRGEVVEIDPKMPLAVAVVVIETGRADPYVAPPTWRGVGQ